MNIIKDTDPAGILDEVLFNRMLSVERKRSERTGAHFLLVLIDFGRVARAHLGQKIEQIGVALAASTRDTDITGWHRDQVALGVIFTALNGTSRHETRAAISGKIQRLLSESLGTAEVQDAEISFHFFPEKEGDG